MKKQVILTSTNKEEYPDLVVECKVITNEEIGEYVKNIPEDRKFTAFKSASVKAREGILGEEIITQIKTIVDGKEYILSELKTKVKEKEIETPKGIIKKCGYVVCNVDSTSNEEYVVNPKTFATSYAFVESTNSFVPVYDLRKFAQVDENIMFETNWGDYVVCLAGSYIVTYDEKTNDYNAVEKDAFKKTYTIEQRIQKKLKRN